MPSVVSVSRSATHSFSKPVVDAITIVEGFGVEGDAHGGATVKHRSRVRVDPTQPNLRQVHLMHLELFEELARSGFVVGSGDLGENIVTQGVPLLDLPTDTLLRIGPHAVVRVTGLRNPCSQIEAFSPGLLHELAFKGSDGNLVRKAGIMSVVVAGGVVRSGDAIEVALPAEPHRRLEKV